MITLVLLACLLASSKGEPFIAGGRVEPREAMEQLPWLVSIENPACKTPSGHICGGSLVSRWHIATAAHCSGYGQTAVFFKDKTYGREHHQVRIKIAGYSIPPLPWCEHDFALARLAKPAPHDIKPVRMVRKKLKPGTMVTAVGWGLTGYDYKTKQGIEATSLNKVNLTVSHYKAPYIFTKLRYGATKMLRDACSGDSGGPLLFRRRQWEAARLAGTVVGGGYDCTTGETNGKVGLWSSVTDFYHWIRKEIYRRGK